MPNYIPFLILIQMFASCSIYSKMCAALQYEPGKAVEIRTTYVLRCIVFVTSQASKYTSQSKNCFKIYLRLSILLPRLVTWDAMDLSVKYDIA